MNLIQILEQEEMARLARKIPAFAPGDTVVVSVNVVEGERKRVQAFEGVVIAKKNRGLNSSFTVRKMSSGEGVERTFQTHSPIIAGVTSLSETPFALAMDFCREPRWSIAAAVMTPFSLETASKLFIFPSEIVTT